MRDNGVARLLHQPVLRDLRQLIAVLRREREMKLLGQLARDLAPASVYGFEQTGSENRRALLIRDCLRERFPALESVARVPADAVPDAAALQPREQHDRPRVHPVAHRTARDRHAAVELAVDGELLEEARHEALDRVDRYGALHRDDGRNAFLGESWPERGQDAVI